jgi:ureidoglycolate lyase
MTEKIVQTITRELFAPYGDMIEPNSDSSDLINSGSVQRFRDLSRIHLLGPDSQACVHIYRAKAMHEPMILYQMERHPFGSQLFMPLNGQSFIMVVTPRASSKPMLHELCAFLVDGGRGVNLLPGIWHHSLLSLAADSDFLVVERASPQENFNGYILDEPICLSMSAIQRT